ncbi:ABC transporter substrate-binding protein [Halodesulfurarchaeum sp.]|uniref:ABC transporter substrate-binding protein n=2 Tax=Halodesulfurarchaeum sp. TaxID=1980530 RepID=UPI002FC2ED16
MNRRRFLGAIGTVGSGAVAGCSTLGSTAPGSSVTLAYDAAPPHFQAVVMDQEGWLDEMAAEYESTEASCNSIVQLLVSGNADIGMIGTVPALVVADSDTEASVVSASSTDAFVVMISAAVADRFETNADGFAGFREEYGRRFKLGTYPKGSVSDITARYWITEVRGESLEDVELVHLGGPGASRQALLAEEVDGGVIPEPTPTLIEERTMAPYRRVTQVGEFIPGEPAGVTVVRDEFAKANPSVVDEFVARHAAATEFIAENRDQAAAYMSDVYGGETALDTATARAALNSPATQYVSDPREIIEGTAVLAEYANRLGKTETVLETDQLVDPSYYERAVEE